MGSQYSSNRSPWLSSCLSHLQAQLYKEKCIIDVYPRDVPVLSTSAWSTITDNYIQCAQFDNRGELLLTGSNEGLLLVHRADELKSHAHRDIQGMEGIDRGIYSSNEQEMRISSIGSDIGNDEEHQTNDGLNGHLDSTGTGSARIPVSHSPILAIKAPLCKLHSAKWNPRNQNMVGIACSGSSHVMVYDLGHTQGSPFQRLSMPARNSGGLAAGDMDFFTASSHGYALLAGGLSGNVFLWDLRASNKSPSATLHSMHGGGITCLQLIENDYAVLAGTEHGEIRSWDLRKGGGAAVTFGGVLYQHPSIMCVSLRNALLDIPGLALECGGIPICSIHSFMLDPSDPARLGFHLGCGWSGVFDMSSETITHIHAPAQPLLDNENDSVNGLVQLEEVEASRIRRKASWTRDGRRFIVPSRQEDSLLFLDFQASPWSGAQATVKHSDVYGFEENKLDSERKEDFHESSVEEHQSLIQHWIPPSAVTVPISKQATCVAVMPDEDVVFAGGTSSFLSIIQC